MDNEMSDTQKRHVQEIVRVVNDILEAQAVILRRVRESYQENLSVYNDLLNKVNLLDKKIEGGFTVLETTRLASLDKYVTEKLKNLESGYLRELKQKLDSIHMKLLQQIQAGMFQLLIKESQRVPKLPARKVLSAISSQVTPPSRRPYIPSAPTPAAPAYQPQQTMEAPDGDWSDRELEGAQIFDNIITGWKRRDWEKMQGTKEMFMRGWKKLSGADRQKIKNGAWSKPIMNKLKMLGRSS